MLRCVGGPRSPHVSSWCGLWFLLPHESSQRFLPAAHPPPQPGATSRGSYAPPATAFRSALEVGAVPAVTRRWPLIPDPCSYPAGVTATRLPAPFCPGKGPAAHADARRARPRGSTASSDAFRPGLEPAGPRAARFPPSPGSGPPAGGSRVPGLRTLPGTEVRLLRFRSREETAL